MGAHRGPAARRLNIGWQSQRVIATILVFFVLGLLFVNACSTSHSQLEHRHAAAGALQGDVEPAHDHDHDHEDAGAAPDVSGTKHTHKHNPGDHTHDVPLRLVLASVQFTFTPDWRPAPPVPVVSHTLDPIERPPKPPASA
ncbi:hypothetical protein [Pseudoduganella namucuonensis]|uniref:Uncharacterized protein n=1 Tax=Pseudoduganella namucuonensis TaxID=1035707 RepID=A0A1I7LPL3_9BURK|nr:hypothetical protein [Pseudoduganella namucuonensis]SFV11642.1 hypothetical protein SAMN05216552_103460 [Pseudoduganella namucuonensis]